VNYTISVAWVLDVPPEELEAREKDALHNDVINHAVSMAELFRQKYPERKFKCILSDMIVSTPEIEIGAKR